MRQPHPKFKYSMLCQQSGISIHSRMHSTVKRHGYSTEKSSKQLCYSLRLPKCAAKPPSYASKNNRESSLLEIKRKYNEFLLKNPANTIKFIWIPSHTGIYGNERADSLAKSASMKEHDKVITLPYTDYYEKYKQQKKIPKE